MKYISISKMCMLIILLISAAHCIDLKHKCSQFTDCNSCSLCTNTPNYSIQNCKVYNLSNCAWCPTTGECIEKTNPTVCPVEWVTNCPFFNENLAIGTTLCIFGGALSIAGGIAGGGVFVPVFILFLGLSPHFAIPLSKVAIVGASVGACLVTMPKTHPNTNRPLVYYDIALIMEPCLLLGTTIGVLLNVLFPAYIITLLLIVILTTFVIGMFKKAVATFIQEREDGRQYGEKAEVDYVNLDDKSNIDPEKSIELNKILRDEARQVPWEKLLLFFFIFAGFFVLVLLRSTKGKINLLDIKCGSWQYWTLFASVIPYILVVNFFIGRHLHKTYERKEACGYEYQIGDVVWNWKNISLFSLVSIFAGIVAGFLGIGGALINSPMMMWYGIIPSVSVATTVFMTLFTSLSTTMQFMLIGRLSLYSALWYCGVGFVAGLLGMLGVGLIVKKYKKQSYVIFIVAFAILCATIGMVIVQTINLVNYFESKGTQSIAFNSACEH
eukprot:TRINITY_DN10871_c0_g1_i1.p1 TRINITY_DN10871_c0_g1~~TRINITY_DN10871_c0_g1_i1.p1  ORF type:complete len:497 (-),score=97.34 TRINITY_DN10871_c0_g1_i1:32-1522(-)